ncbi:hypothetical protein [Natronoflexus pectinivorans]|uniref:Lipoprotein n=1 Tax=Natronoflexus pectinivorans TaxID=682526 RepID=A0A4R2GPD0_9BACT|nr:hypothetical protein [Natronoflexus pectinivorans]TCO10990.1 hypothetical protein EV194_101624 [Natronoflexus pectinivorans]
MKSFVINRIFYLSLLVMMLFASCHSKQVSLNFSTHHGACWNSDSTKIAVIISSTAFRRPEGISRFPDGGRVKHEFKKTALYIYSLEDKSLLKVDDFSDLANIIGTNRSKWRGRIDFRDSIIYYQIEPVIEWDFLKHLAANNVDKLMLIPELKEKYTQTFQYKIVSGEIMPADTNAVKGLFENTRQANLTQLNQKLNDVPVSQMGLVLRDFHQKPERKLINETIFLQNKSALTRRAVFEQIISELSNEELKSVLNRMDNHQSRLTGLEKERYEKASKELYENIKALL